MYYRLTDDNRFVQTLRLFVQLITPEWFQHLSCSILCCYLLCKFQVVSTARRLWPLAPTTVRADRLSSQTKPAKYVDLYNWWFFQWLEFSQRWLWFYHVLSSHFASFDLSLFAAHIQYPWLCRQTTGQCEIRILAQPYFASMWDRRSESK